MKNRRQNGFTLLEVLISLLIVTIVLGEVMILSSASQKAGLLSGQRLEAYNLAMEQKELMEAQVPVYASWWDYTEEVLGAKSLSNTGTCFGVSSGSILRQGAGSGCVKTVDGVKYTVWVDVLVDYPEDITNVAIRSFYRKIDIKVSWPNSLCVGTCTNQDESVNMDYYITKEGYTLRDGL